MKTAVPGLGLELRRKYHSSLLYKYPGEIFLFVDCDNKNELKFETRLCPH